MRSSSQCRVIEDHLSMLLGRVSQAMILQCGGVTATVHMRSSY